MKKKITAAICIFLVLLFLIPIPMRLKDGGTVKYQAVLYSISDVHRLAPSEAGGYEEGIIVEVLGIPIYHSIDQNSNTVQFHGKTFNKSDLSTETLEWLEKYNALSEDEQLAISYIPADLYKLCGYDEAEDAPVG